MAAKKRSKSDAPVEAVSAREKLVRDSFTLPESDYKLLAALKQRLLAGGCEAKKSEVVRAGLLLLATLEDDGLRQAFDRVARIKTGRPAKRRKNGAPDAAASPATDDTND